MATTADNGRNNKTAVEQPGPADQADTQRLGEAHSKKRKRNHTKVIHRSNNAFIPDTVTITTGTRSAQKAKVQFSEKIIRAIACPTVVSQQSTEKSCCRTVSYSPIDGFWNQYNRKRNKVCSC